MYIAIKLKNPIVAISKEPGIMHCHHNFEFKLHCEGILGYFGIISALTPGTALITFLEPNAAGNYKLHVLLYTGMKLKLCSLYENNEHWK